jgi:hypothetical protein
MKRRCILQRFAGQRKPLSAGIGSHAEGKRQVALRSSNKKPRTMPGL